MTMRALLAATILVVAAVSRCEAPAPPPPGPPPEPRPGEFVRVRGRLAEDVDCRLLKAEDGRTYSLTERLPQYRNGTRLCVYGTIATVSQCMQAPTIEVQQLRPYSSCR
jgi:hypothetical protein